MASVDITKDNQAIYDEAYAAGEAAGAGSVVMIIDADEAFVTTPPAAGAGSMDITSDNQTASMRGTRRARSPASG